MEFFQNTDLATLTAVVIGITLTGIAVYKLTKTKFTALGSRWTWPPEMGYTVREHEAFMNKWFPKTNKNQKHSVKESSNSVKDGDTKTRRVVEDPEHQT